MSRTVRALGAAVVLSMVATGCGDGSRVVADGSGEQASPSAPELGYCAEAQTLHSISALIDEGLAAFRDGDPDPAGFDADLARLVAQLEKMRAIAPDRFRADYDLLASGMGMARRVLSEAGYDPAKLTRAQADVLASAIGSPEWDGAGMAIAEYDQEACGIVRRDEDTGAKADLRNALVAALVFYTDEETYVASPEELEEIEPSLRFTRLADADAGTIGFTATSETILLVTRSPTGTYFCISHNEGRTGYGSGGRLSDVNSLAKCKDPSW